MKSETKLLILDAHALIHRAYHALPPSFVTKSGQLVNAVYGFTSVLIKTLQDQKPTHVVAAFDSKLPTFRHEKFKAYKAQRPITAADLTSQIPLTKKVLEAFGVPILEAPGFEADDIIGALVEKFFGKAKILIVTGDLDALQLVKDGVEVLTFKKGVSDVFIYDKKAVFDRFGLEPKQLIDFKALKGDPSDNIPGVPGIGEKTASTLLQKFKTIEKIYETIEIQNSDIKDSLKNKLKENKEVAFSSRDLVVLKTDIPLKVELKDTVFGGLQPNEKIESLFQEFGFFSLFERLNKSQTKFSKEDDETTLGSKNQSNKTRIFTEEIYKKTKRVLVGVLEDGRFFISASPDEHFTFVFSGLGKIKDVLENKEVEKIGYDLKKTKHALIKEGINLGGNCFDVMIAAYLLHPGRRDYPLERIVFQELRRPPNSLKLPQVLVLALWEIYERQLKKLEENDLKKVFFEIEMPLIDVLVRMEGWGIKVELSDLKKLSKKLKSQLDLLENKIHKIAGTKFNINSPAQLSDILFNKLRIETKGLRKTPGGVISTQASELSKLSPNPFIDLVLEYRELSKLKTTYIDALPKLVDVATGRLHTSFVQTGTATGRLSSEEPNLQNIPIRSEAAQDIRRAFIAEKGYELVSFDYSQIELRLAAAFSQDEKMLEAFRLGQDIHALTAAEVNGIPIEKVDEEMRRQAKVLNFGILYGMGANAFAQSAGVSKERAREFIDEYFKKFAGVARYIEEIKDQARQLGFVRTITGRRRYIPEIHAQHQMVRSQAERIAVNMPIQGSDADISKMSMVAVDRKFSNSKDVRMLLQIHDALLFEISKSKIKEVVPEIKSIMEGIIKLPVALRVDVKSGPNWGDAKPYKI
ncbi:DNA polymerase I [Candidatus Parcubacteria bacterium]|nr:MAG: DNA polymerase I [Candidatus Parcubacteria bacterium]